VQLAFNPGGDIDSQEPRDGRRFMPDRFLFTLSPEIKGVEAAGSEPA
jgi:hypothetical protein